MTNASAKANVSSRRGGPRRPWGRAAATASAAAAQKGGGAGPAAEPSLPQARGFQLGAAPPILDQWPMGAVLTLPQP